MLSISIIAISDKLLNHSPLSFCQEKDNEIFVLYIFLLLLCWLLKNKLMMRFDSLKNYTAKRLEFAYNYLSAKRNFWPKAHVSLLLVTNGNCLGGLMELYPGLINIWENTYTVILKHLFNKQTNNSFHLPCTPASRCRIQ